MVYWAPLLHFYQPPLQLPGVLRKVCNESYRPLIDVFRQHPHARATVNICGVLTEMLRDYGHMDVIHGLRQLAERGQIEFTGSAKYHPILPLIPNGEVERQIRRNFLTNREFFGDVFAPKGFFPPEMAYGPSILDPIIDSRHQWIIVSGVACPAPWPMSQIYQVGADDETISVVFRDDILSNRISFQHIDVDGFLGHLRNLWSGQRDVYVVTAMDAETFGHHIQNWEKLFLAEVYEGLASREDMHPQLHQTQPLAEQHSNLFAAATAGSPCSPAIVAREPATRHARTPGRRRKRPLEGNVAAVTISELVNLFPKGPRVEPIASSWSTTREDISAGNPYPLWDDPHNVLHWLQWHHANLSIDIVHQAETCADNPKAIQHADIARQLLDEALHSCQFWWASKRPHWDINMIARGLSQQSQAILNGYRAIKLGNCTEAMRSEYYYRVVGARDLAAKIYDRLFED